MNRKIAFLVVALITATFMSGCGGNQTQSVQPQTGGQNMQQTESVGGEQQSVAGAKEQQQPNQAAQTSEAGVDKSAFIGEEKAKEIALKQAGISAEDVVFEKVELDRDDGVWQYEVEFRKDNIEYDVEIQADNGGIQSYQKDIDD